MKTPTIQSLLCAALLALCACATPTEQTPGASPEPGEQPVAQQLQQQQTRPAQAPKQQGVGAPQPATAADRKSAVIIQIKDQPILAREILDVIIERHRKVFDQVIQDLLIERVMQAENERMGIVVPDKVLDAEVAQEMTKAESYARVQYQMGIAELLKRQGRSLATFKQAARQKARTRHMLDRMVRYDQLTSGAVKVRHIVLKDPAKAKELLAKIKQGADFIKLAEQYSTGPSSKNGGLLPMVTPGILAEPEVERIVLALEPGQVSGVVKSKMGYHIFRSLYRHPKKQASYAKLEPQVVASLGRYPLVGEIEINFWLKKLRKRYPIKQFF